MLGFKVFFSCKQKLAYSFQKCCFDSEKVGLVKECDRMSCILNGSHSFDFFFIETSMKVFIVLTENSWRRGGGIGAV